MTSRIAGGSSKVIEDGRLRRFAPCWGPETGLGEDMTRQPISGLALTLTTRGERETTSHHRGGWYHAVGGGTLSSACADKERQ